MEWAKQLLQILRLPAKIFVAVAISAGVLFLLPKTWLAPFGLDAFLTSYGVWVGIAFYAALALTLTNLVSWTVARLQRRRAEKRREERIVQKLRTLDPHEQAVLREFIIQAKNTVELPINQHVVAGLVDSGVLQVIGGYATNSILHGIRTSVRLSNVAASAMTTDDIGLPSGEPTDAEKSRILSQRPLFVTKHEEFQSLFRYGM